MKLERLDFVRATYWIGAIVDALAALQLLWPTGSKVLGFPGLRAPGVAGQPAIVAAVLMLGWSVVLVWGHLRTRDRRTVLAITLVVVAALAASNVALGVSGATPWAQLAPPLAIQAVLMAMFAASWRIARAAWLEREAAAA
jgi:peptidoglycan/LPS O-acetylase OafA/YrhL